ncbi:hypothetical protein SARC_16912, partial [Sphaeroforma arctica JP610]
TDFLPNWPAKKGTKAVRDAVYCGVPPMVREKAWCVALGNELQITKGQLSFHSRMLKMTHFIGIQSRQNHYWTYSHYQKPLSINRLHLTRKDN